MARTNRHADARAPKAAFPASAVAAALIAAALLPIPGEPAHADESALPADGRAAYALLDAVGASLSGTDGRDGALESIVEKGEQAQEALSRATDHMLGYDRSLIEAIGSQQSTGHWICCPCFACAYGDAVIYGTANAHEGYGCGMCTWPGWGGGNSSFRSLGTDQALLREAYDSIAAGYPTVVHVAGASGEHWICLVGYRDAEDPDNLSLDNFIALDPTDGAQIVASERYALYGDACEHVSDAL